MITHVNIMLINVSNYVVHDNNSLGSKIYKNCIFFFIKNYQR